MSVRGSREVLFCCLVVGLVGCDDGARSNGAGGGGGPVPGAGGAGGQGGSGIGGRAAQAGDEPWIVGSCLSGAAGAGGAGGAGGAQYHLCGLREGFHTCPLDKACGSDGSCVTCEAGLTACTLCADLKTNGQNCGACGHACGDEQICVAGSCACLLGKTECTPGWCSDLSFDAVNCGGCGHACDLAREVCSKGTCVADACVGLRTCDCGAEIFAVEPGPVTFGDLPIVNVAGAVAFATNRRVSPNVRLSVVKTKIDHHEALVGEVCGGLTDVAINALGELAVPFSAPDVGSGVVLFNGADMPIVWPLDGSYDPYGTYTWIDRAGDVTYRAGASSGGGIRRSDGGPSETLVPDPGPAMYLTAMDVNGGGDVAYIVTAAAGEGDQSVMLWSQGVSRLLLDEAGFPGNVIGTISLNDAGDVAFTADSGRDDLNVTLYVASGAGGPPAERGLAHAEGQVAIDETGAVAVADANGLKIVFSTGVERIVLAPGDSLLGSSVIGIGLASAGYRGQGQLAFMVGLSDNRRVLVRTCEHAP